MRDALDRALGPTPQPFCERMDATLRSLKEEQQVRKMSWRTALAVALMTVLGVSTAYALLTQGLTWYYENRFTAYQRYEPEKHEAILRNLETQVQQWATEDPEIVLQVAETSYLPEHQMLVVSLAATAKDPGVVLYPMDSLDTDGAYVGEGGNPAPAADGEDRAVHWLWTREGFGPVEAMTGGKPLLLLTAHELWWEDVELLGDGSSYDAYVDEHGVTCTVMQIELKEMLSPEWEATVQARIDAGMNASYWQQRLEAVKRFRAALAEDEDGVMTLRIPYTVTAYSDDDAQLYDGGRQGEIAFEVKLK